MLRRYAAVLVVLTGGCVSRTVTPKQAMAVGEGRPGEAEAVARLAITLDASGDLKADTLYAPDAIVVENARMRLGAPRFAGIASAGRHVSITAASENVAGRFAWLLVDYTWYNAAGRRAEAARATFVCERRGESWKIVHVHSSQPLPWEP